MLHSSNEVIASEKVLEKVGLKGYQILRRIMARLRHRDPEMPQRQSLRGPFQMRTSSSDSDPLYNWLTVHRSPKLGERRSPHGSADFVNQKKFGTRIADLDKQVAEAAAEKKIRNQKLIENTANFLME
ncbi:hypothetical protein Syun_006882 [Stephania yunnanensis]|uniref:Uncharacterized protein n=1 Tax=Stephania yunnanensis TaxID=152371 RepID=A0AAP0Q1U0_9MAGN